MSARRTAQSLALFVAAASYPPAHAYRPFVSTDAAVVAPRNVELELGYFGLEQDESETTFVTPQTVLNIGLIPRLELVGEFEVRTSEEGAAVLAEPAVFLKGIVREGVLQSRPGPSVALEAGPTLPETSEDQDGIGWETMAILSTSLGAFLFHVNAGGGMSREGDALGLWGLIVERPLGSGVRVVTEWNGEALSAHPEEQRFLLGCIWESTFLPLSLDLGLRRGLAGNAPEWELTTGLTVRMTP